MSLLLPCALVPWAECLYVFPCQWNYRPDHCMYGSNCRGAEQEGVSILHGNRGVYHDDKQPTFKALYEVIRDVSAASTASLCVPGWIPASLLPCQPSAAWLCLCKTHQTQMNVVVLASRVFEVV